MEAIYGLRRNVKELYRTKSIMLNITYKIVMAFIALLIINNSVGSVVLLKNPIISLALSIGIGLLPIFFGIVVIGMIATIHIFNISMIVGAMSIVILILAGILSARMAPGSGWLGLTSFVMASFGGTFVAPIALPMAAGPTGVLPTVAGLGFARVLVLLNDTKAELQEMSELDGAVKFLEILMSDKALIAVIIICTISYLLASIFKMLPIMESWKIGLVVASLTSVMGAFLLKILWESPITIFTVIMYSILGIVIGLVVEFFVHNVEYKTTEILNFEDDEYFYYVKAIPKREADKSQKISESKMGKKSKSQVKSNTREINKDSGKSPTRSNSRNNKNTRTQNKSQSSNSNNKGSRKSNGSSRKK